MVPRLRTSSVATMLTTSLVIGSLMANQSAPVARANGGAIPERATVGLQKPLTFVPDVGVVCGLASISSTGSYFTVSPLPNPNAVARVQGGIGHLDITPDAVPEGVVNLVVTWNTSTNDCISSTTSEIAYDITITGNTQAFPIYVQDDGDSPFPMSFSGRGSWDATTPLFVAAAPALVSPKTSITVGELSEGQKVRAYVDLSEGGFGGVGPDGCFGVNPTERSAITVVDGTEVIESGRDCEDSTYLQAPPNGTSVTFDIDMHLSNKTNSTGAVIIEVDADGDGFNKGKGDQAFSIPLHTEFFMRFDPASGDFFEAVTSDPNAFRDDVGVPGDSGVQYSYFYLDPLPACANVGDAGPCIATSDNNWRFRLTDMGAMSGGLFQSLSITPYRSVSPYEVEVGDPTTGRVAFTLRIPEGLFRGQVFGDTPQAGFSLGESRAYWNDFAYSHPSAKSYAEIAFDVEARSSTQVFAYGDGAEWDFADLCRQRIGVEDGIVYTDENENFSYDSGEEVALSCQNQPAAVAIDSVMLRPDVVTINTASAHSLDEGDTVTVCCVGEPFDGTNTVASIVDVDTFTLDTTQGALGNVYGAYRNIDWTALFDEGDQRSGMVALDSNRLMVTQTQVSLDVNLIVPFGEFEQALAGGYVTTNAQGFAFGNAILEGRAFDFGVAGPSYTAAEEGNNPRTRRTDGFFQVCMPEAALTEWFGLSVDAAASAMQTTRSDAGGAATEVSPSVDGARGCGIGPGLQLELIGFGFSAPYFKVAPRRTSSDPPPLSGTGEPGPASGVDAEESEQKPASIPVISPSESATAEVITLSNVASLTAAQVAALTPQQLAELDPSLIRALPPASLAGLAPNQIAVLTPTQVNALRPAQAARLKPEAVSAMTPRQLTALRPAAVAALAPQAFGALSADQLGAIRDGAFARISATLVRRLSGTQVGKLAPTALGQLKPSVIDDIRPATMRALSRRQLGGLTSAQVAALSPRQLAALTGSQRSVLKA